MQKPLISSILVKPASADCNLHCTYCFYHDRPTDPYASVRGRHVMDDSTLRILIREGMRLMPQVATFGWQGGEPTLTGVEFFRRVVSYQQQFGRSGQSVCNGIQTNATLIDDEWAALFAQYNFLVGVSLDGPQQWHDHYRHAADGRGSYSRVMQSIEILRRHRVEFNILSVVNRLTADHPDEILTFMLEHDFRYLQFIPCVERDPTTGALTDFTVRPQQFADFMCRVFDLWYNDGQPEVSIRLFDNLLLAYAGHGPQVCQFQEECGDYVVVEYNGDVYPCDFYVRQDLWLGNLHQASLEEMAASDKAIAFRRRKRWPDPACDTCPWLHICNRGCPMMRDHNPAGDAHYLCAAYQQLFAYAERRLSALSARIPPPPPPLAPSPAPPAEPRVVGRNDLCPCGSGKKYKQCCGRRSHRATER
ncbi:MAG: anaerobic sulfatase maturase [Anaerolineae bacterium]|nr:anaerobic sulfatase maturase [Anaerolineae bacterium]